MLLQTEANGFGSPEQERMRGEQQRRRTPIRDAAAAGLVNPANHPFPPPTSRQGLLRSFFRGVGRANKLLSRHHEAAFPRRLTLYTRLTGK
ncbi:hypothetical protein MRX96_058494 [Rhipicephalus microplus]